MQLIQLLQRLRKRHRPVRRMQVKDIHALRLQLLQRLQQHLPHRGRLMRAGLLGVPFRREGEPALFPVRGGGEGFLGTAHVDARGVDFVVALGLEVVEAFVVFVQGSDAGAGGFVGPEGHEAEDDLGGER